MKEAVDFVVNELNIKDNEKLVVAVSGGPDSMYLLNVLINARLEFARRNCHIDIVCAHVNHNVRKESADEKVFVKEYCEKKNVIFECYEIENYGDDNFHSEARTKRYNFFEELINKYKARYLFTAHHGDDLMETILMRIVRGSSLKGYSGFAKIVKFSNYTIVRPLINLTKKEIQDYDIENNIPYVTDKSNEKDVYTRNRYRKYILPVLKNEDENVHYKFYKFSKILQEYNEYIDKIVNEKLKKIYVKEQLKIDDFLKEEHVIQMRIIYSILESIYQDDLMLITDKHAELIYNLIVSKKTNTKVNLPNNIVVYKEYNICSFQKGKCLPNNYEIEINGQVILPNGKNIDFIKETELKSNYICRLNSDEIVLPLMVRNHQNGDRISVKGMNGSKKINDIFIDDKIPASERENWPVVVDSVGTIIWLPGLKKSKLDKTKEEKYDIILRYY